MNRRPRQLTSSAIRESSLETPSPTEGAGKLLKPLALSLIGVFAMTACSLSPRMGAMQDPSEPISFSMVVPHGEAASDEFWVRWQGGLVNSDGEVYHWETLAFITRPNSGNPFTLPDGRQYRAYSASNQFFGWTRHHTGYTGGCGNVPNSCPEHGLIRAQIGYPSGVVSALVFPDGANDCIVSSAAEGGLSVINDCAMPEVSDGIVVLYTGR